MRVSKILASAAMLLLIAAFPDSGARAAAVARDYPLLCVKKAAKPCGWTIAWRTAGTTVDSYGSSLRIVNQGDGVGFLERPLPLGGPTAIQLVRFSALVKPDSVTGKGAGLTVTFLDKGGQMLASHDMGYGDFGMAQGTGDYRRLEIVAAAPVGASQVKPGLILYGPGTALFTQPRMAIRPVGHDCSAFGRSYVNAAIRIMRVHSLVRDNVDFSKLAKEGCAIAGRAMKAEQAYPAIRFLIDQLGDHHSFFFSRDEIAHWKGADKPAAGAPVQDVAMPTAHAVEAFGYVKVPGFHSDDAAAKARFAQAIQDDLAELSAHGARGWIIDLRDNDGGNMFPMLAGLAPLFDQTRLGYLVDGDGKRDAWGIGPDGPAPRDPEYVAVARPVHLNATPIAVLYGPRTGSSGEIVILSFVHNADTRSFGQPSYGLTTGNGIFPLPDGSELRLASTHMADRTGLTYSGPVRPDVIVDSQATSPGRDPVIDAALTWLRSAAGTNPAGTLNH
jgi:carboxyl-terminal processing protease